MKDFWNGKKVLITGHTGFVGSWLSCVLQYFGAEITGFALQEESGSLYSKIKHNLYIQNVYGDLRNEASLRKCIISYRPEIIFHIAAFGFIKECFENPERAFSTNVNGTFNLLNIINQIDFPCRLIVASSDKVYKNNDLESYLFTENDALGGTDPYSASKTCEDILVQSFYESYMFEKGHSLCIVRPSNILGGGDHNMSRLIPSIYADLNAGCSPKIRNPYAVRPWQNILDVVDAYLVLATQESKKSKYCSIYNVGPEQDSIKTVKEIAEYISSLYGISIENRQKNRYNKHLGLEKKYLGLSIEKIKKDIGWKPKRTLEQTLADIYDFYKKDTCGDVYSLCILKIKNYYSD